MPRRGSRSAPTAKPEFAIVDSGDPAKVVVEIAGAQIPEKLRRTLELSALDREVVKVSAFPYTKGEASLVRVVAQLRQPVPFRAVAEADRIIVDFERATAPPAVPVAAAAAPPEAPAPAAAAAAPAPRGARRPRRVPSTPAGASRSTSRTPTSTTSCG